LQPPTEYGREYAIKLLSKADLDEEELVAQLTEVGIRYPLLLSGPKIFIFSCQSPL
jgi:hypothetical protein